VRDRHKVLLQRLRVGNVGSSLGSDRGNIRSCCNLFHLRLRPRGRLLAQHLAGHAHELRLEGLRPAFTIFTKSRSHLAKLPLHDRVDMIGNHSSGDGLHLSRGRVCEAEGLRLHLRELGVHAGENIMGRCLQSMYTVVQG